MASGSCYVISDIHSCWEKFPKSIPRDASKVILLGDMWNKGSQQIQMLSWCLKHRHDERFVFVWGNAESRANCEVVLKFFPNQPKLMTPWFGTHTGYERNKNISNIIINLVEQRVIKLDDVMDYFQNCLKWYHVEPGNNGIKWICAHASWELNKGFHNQDKLNLVYDSHNLLAKLRKKDYIPNIPKEYNGYNWIFGHVPIYSFSNQIDPPVVLKKRFYYIDAGIFKRSRIIFYLKIK